jgi:hypothetical protein
MSASSLADATPLIASGTRAEETARWNAATRVAFRFFFVFFPLYSLPSPLGDFVESLAVAFENFWMTLVAAVAQRFFGISVTYVPSGSGDTQFHYFQLLIIASVSAIAALIWTLVDRRAASYPRLHALLRFYVRYTLAIALIGYGAFKVIQSQFPQPSADRLLQPIGDSSPMGPLWTLMGISRSYNIFTGLGELAGGLLLTTRRTTLLGALVTIGVMSNVVMLNFSYDVPVKIYSSILLLMAVFLAAPDARRTRYFFQAADLKAQTLMLQERGDAALYTLRFRKTANNALTLDGNLKGQNVHATLRLAEEQTFLLTSRGFHWINEVPFNQ